MDSIGKIEKLEQRLKSVEGRLAVLEGNHGLDGEEGDKILEMDLILPEADIDGLHFNETKVNAVFEKQDDGWYHSQDILFVSARNTEDDNRRDILTEYLQRDVGIDSLTLRQQIAAYFGVAVINVEITLPRENEGIKEYNGVPCRYWLTSPYSGSTYYFTFVSSDGGPYNYFANFAYGVAPAFCVR